MRNRSTTDNPARSAVQQQIFLQFPTDPLSDQASITVPMGKILVLEFVAFSATFPPGATLVLTIFATGNQIQGSGQSDAIYDLLVPPPTTGTIPVFSIGSQLVKIYAQPGTTLT